MPEIIEDFPVPGKLRPAVRSEAPQREEVEERAAGEQDDQQDREQKSRYRKSNNDHGRGPGVEPGAVHDSLANAERDRDQIGQERHPDPERHRDRQLLLDQLQHADIAKIALAEIEPREIPYHQREAFRRRLVADELLFPNPGASPAAPRYFERPAPADAPTGARAPKSPPDEPEIRDEPPVSAPLSCA